MHKLAYSRIDESLRIDSFTTVGYFSYIFINGILSLYFLQHGNFNPIIMPGGDDFYYLRFRHGRVLRLLCFFLSSIMLNLLYARDDVPNDELDTTSSAYRALIIIELLLFSYSFRSLYRSFDTMLVFFFDRNYYTFTYLISKLSKY